MYRFQWIQYAWSYCGLFLLKDASCSQYILEIHFSFSFLKLYISPQSSEDWLWQANAAWHSSQSVGVIYIQCVYQKLCYNVTTGHNGSHIDPVVKRQIESTCLPSCWIIMGSSFSGSSKLKKKIQSMALRRGNYWFACFPECLYVCIHQSRALQ